MARAEFRDPPAGREILTRIAGRAPAGVVEALTTLLPDSPDPDGALTSFERLLENGGRELLRLLDRRRFLIHYALAVFGYSRFLGDTLIQNPDLLSNFLKERVLDRSYSQEELHESCARFRARSAAPKLTPAGTSSPSRAGAGASEEMSLVLARFKRREYVRIMLRDVLGIAPLAETTAEISALSDVLIEEALSEAEVVMRRRYGSPQHLDREGRVSQTPFAVLALGKLGGKELNYSSDVDLLYIYGDGEELATAPISHREYFIRLAQLVTQILAHMTVEGRVFRIDLRLRPQGGEGDPAIGLSPALRYYAQAAQDWERQALIKARFSAGSSWLAREFIRGVQPYVYRQRINFTAVETALDTRERISARRARAQAGGIDVKLDRGGIRDIEFLVQCLQRVYGGAEPWLRSGGTLFSLQKLHDKGHISGKEFHELTAAYEFLRRVEHRLQLRHGQQTHRLPDSAEQLRILQRAVGTDKTLQYASGGIAAAVRQRMAAVAEIYEHIIHHQQLEQAREGEGEFNLLPRVEQSGAEPYQQLLQRVGEDSPALYEIATRPDLGAATRRNLYRFLSAAFTSSERYASVLRDVSAVERALDLFAGSDFLTDILIRYPEEIAGLKVGGGAKPAEGAGRLFPEAAGGRGASSDPAFTYLGAAEAPPGEKLALLRRHYRHRVFASGAADILQLRPVYESLQKTSAAADDAIRAAFAIAGQPEGLGVLALGRLGTQEFDLLSDADLLFVREESLVSEAAMRSAGQIMQALAAYTREGTVFPVDARLRPRGAEGELVVTAAELGAYCAQEAQAWEALTFTKLRPIVGSERVAGAAAQAAGALRRRFAADQSFAQAVREMRQRLENAEPEKGNFKAGPGAVYDIDFIACYLAIRQELAENGGNLRERLCRLRERRLLEESDWTTLDRAAELFRTVEHAVRLVTGKARKSLPGTEHGRCATERLTARLLKREFVGGLDAELARTMAEVRGIYERVVK